MPQMINRGQELIRICPKDAKKIEYSTNGGRAWMIRCQETSTRDKFTDLMDNGKEISAKRTTESSSTPPTKGARG